ncbi:hypothetical protein vseg_000632 [Gypsophila vaccaria]
MSSNAVINNNDTEMVIPRFVALKTIGEDPPKYMCNQTADKTKVGYLGFFTTRVLDRLAKFELVPFTLDDDDQLYHVRSCSNNKYWRADSDGHWVVAAAEKPVTNMNLWDCTLFKLKLEGTTVTLTHQKSNQELCLKSFKDEDSTVKFLFAGKPCTQEVKATIINVGSIMVLPRYVSFKGKNDKYLATSIKNVVNPRGRTVYYNGFAFPASKVEPHTNLQFSWNENAGKAAVFEVINTDDGFIRIKSTESGKFLRVQEGTQWVEADIVDGEGDEYGVYGRHPLQYIFEAIRADKDRTSIVALRSIAVDKYCVSSDGRFDRTNCLWAGADSPEENARFELVEPVIERTINVVKFKLRDALITSETLSEVATNNFPNNSAIEQETRMEMKFTHKKSRTWNNGITVKTGFSFSLKAGIPDKFGAEFTVSSEQTRDYQWGNSIEKTSEVTSGMPIKVPPWKHCFGKFLATECTFEIPFTYSQTDRLSTGESVPYPLQYGVFTGVGAYNFTTVFQFQDLVPPVSAASTNTIISPASPATSAPNQTLAPVTPSATTAFASTYTLSLLVPPMPLLQLPMKCHN